MAKARFPIGGTGKLHFTAKYKGGVDPIQPANISGLILGIKINGQIVTRFEYNNPGSGNEPLVVEESPKFTAYLTRPITQDWFVGDATLEVLQKTTVAGFDEGYFDQASKDLFEVYEHAFSQEEM